ncbi:MAG: S-layer homology domain-containing protein [Oscillospiraceae bacterium]
MKQKTTRFLALFLAVCLCLGAIGGAGAVSSDKLNAAIADTAKHMTETVKSPQVGTIGGEWAVFGLARSGFKVSDKYYQDYYDTLTAYVKACKGKLHDKKYTEYSRIIITLSALGKNPADVGGYNLLTPLGDYDKTVWQGINGPIWALLALDSGAYAMPQNPKAKTQATRDMYIRRILDCQLSDGGWSLQGGAGSISDPDISGMALQALAKYQAMPEVKRATEQALSCLSKQQGKDGGYGSRSTDNSESVVQVIVALCELGISLDDPRFVKNGNTTLYNLMTFYSPQKGFLHTSDGGGSNQMATEQGFYALVAAERLQSGKPSLYRMSDALKISTPDDDDIGKGEGLAGKNADVKAQAIASPGKTFDDISTHKNRPAIEALASRGIIKGKSDTAFDPNASVTRAEFATIVVKALGLAPKAVGNFSDVPANAWYAPLVGTAYTYKIAAGVDAAHFNPLGTITRQEAAVMAARAAVLCGMDTALDEASVQGTLARFSDCIKCAEWARSALAFCYGAELLPQTDTEILPMREMKRCEIAQMLFNLLGTAKLL